MTSARELTAHLADLLRREHSAMADFLVALADFDRRRLWEELGHASLFSFLRRELRLSAGAAQYRKTAAELVQRYPQVEAALRNGQLCLSSVIEVAKVITPENATGLLPRFFGLSSRDAAFVAVSIRPVEDPPRRDLVVTPLRLAAAPPSPSCGDPSAAPHGPPGDAGALEVRAPETVEVGAAAPPTRPAAVPPTLTVEPLDATRARVHLTVRRRLLEKLAAARDALSHSHPGAGADEILEAGLDLILERHAKRRGLVSKPRKSPPASGSSPSARGEGPLPGRGEHSRAERAGVEPRRSKADSKRSREHVPTHVMRAVWKRDGGACVWPLDGGGVCGSNHQVELDHIHPVARGGPSTIDNCRLLCRPHQLLAARRVYGDAWMDRFTQRRAPPPPEAAPDQPRR
jgi:5-methylcytosine-specific restriction endonuclease McrA